MSIMDSILGAIEELEKKTGEDQNLEGGSKETSEGQNNPKESPADDMGDIDSSLYGEDFRKLVKERRQHQG